MRGGILVLFFIAMTAARAEAAASSAQEQPDGALAQAAEAGASARQEPAPANVETLRAESKDLQARAGRLFREGRFIEAAELLQEAHRVDPRPILLFNAGQAYRKAERAKDAKAMYEQFLAAAPDHALVPETRGYLKDMEALLAMQRRAEAVALALEEQLSATQTSKRQAMLALEEERRRAQQIAQTLLSTQAQLERDRQKLVTRKRWILGLSIGIPAVVAAIIGGTAGAVSYSRSATDGGTALISK
jgi:tetratricopeptide (TPR) repeat protein